MSIRPVAAQLLELLGELIAEGRGIILFSHLTAMLDLIKPELDRRDYAWVQLTGASKDRHPGGAVPSRRGAAHPC